MADKPQQPKPTDEYTTPQAEMGEASAGTEEELGVPMVSRAAAMTWGATGILEILLGVQNFLIPWASKWTLIPYVILAIGVATLVLAYGFMKLRPWATTVGTGLGLLFTLVMGGWVVCSFLFFSLFSLLALFCAMVSAAAFVVSVMGRETMVDTITRRKRLKDEGLDFTF